MYIDDIDKFIIHIISDNYTLVVFKNNNPNRKRVQRGIDKFLMFSVFCFLLPGLGTLKYQLRQDRVASMLIPLRTQPSLSVSN